MNKTNNKLINIIICISILCFMLSLSTIFWNYSYIKNDFYAILFELRLPRYLSALLVGGILGICGCLMQNITHNPLAEPNILGVASCSSVGSILFLLLNLNAVIGGVIGSVVGIFLLSMGLVFRKHDISNINTYILLKGLIINSICAAIISLILQISPYEKLPSLIFWIMGDLSYVSWEFTYYLFGALLLALVILHFYRFKLNYLWVDDYKAYSLGVSLDKLKIILFGIVAILIGLTTSQIGSVGFVGIIAPYFIKYISSIDKKNNKSLSIIHQVYFSGVFGAFLVSIADGIARNVIYPSTLSISIVTSFIGVPIFWKILQDMHFNKK